MKRWFNLIVLLLVFFSISAQTFLPTDTEIPSIYYSDAKWGDIDNDDDYDLIVIPKYEDGNFIFINNDGNFSPINILIPKLYISEIEWLDYNNDNYLDFIVAGNGFTKIYINQIDTFIIANLDLQVYTSPAVAVGDYDNDGDSDILISGKNVIASSILYENFQTDSFIVHENPINSIYQGSVEFGDFNNDLILDILYGGYDFNGNRSAGVYKGNEEDFSKFQINIQEGGSVHSIWSDIDSDGELDIINSGLFDPPPISQVLYNRNGSFISQNLPILIGGDVKAGDFNLDGRNDIFAVGEFYDSYGGGGIGVSFLNDGSSFIKDTVFGPVTSAISFIAAIGDLDNDNDLDIFLSTPDSTNQAQSVIYINQTETLNTKPSAPTNLSYHQEQKSIYLSWDESSDDRTSSISLTYNVFIGTQLGICDVVSPMSNLSNGFRRVASNGNSFHNTSFKVNNLPPGIYYWAVQAVDNSYVGSEFSEIDSFIVKEEFVLQFEFPGNINDIGDYDNDGDLDVFCNSFILENRIDSFVRYEVDIDLTNCRLGDFNNDNNLDLITSGIVYENINSVFHAADTLIEGDVSKSHEYYDIGDFNNDGKNDIILKLQTSNRISRLYINKGGFAFEKSSDFSYPFSPSYFADIDNDEDLDIIDWDKYFLNEGEKLQEFISYDIFYPLNAGSVDFCDFDNDRDLDLLVTGEFDFKNRTVLLENRDTCFYSIDHKVRGVSVGKAIWFDYNSDGTSDILLHGQSSNNITKIYKNIDESFFDIGYDFGWKTNIGSFDFDNDFDLDLIFEHNSNTLQLWENHYYVNHLPKPPNELYAVREGLGIKLNWNEGSDLESIYGGLSYNIRIGTVPEGVDIISPLSDITNGFRKVSRIGNCNMNLGWHLDSLPEGTYYWSVQAIDQGFMGGEWAPEQTFTISVVRGDFEADTICLGAETSFTDLTLTSGDPIAEWKWDFGDGNTSTLQNPVHTYLTADTFDVQLIAISSQYSDTITKQVIVKPKPTANFSAELACLGTNTQFVNSSDANGLNISSWSWDFGDGSASNVENPIDYRYLDVGNYTAELIATADNGCSDTIQKTVTVAGYPSKSVSVDGALQFCAGDSVILTVEHDNQYNYQWLTGGAAITGADSSNFKALETGVYSAQITNTIGNCITISDDKTVTVANAPAPPTITVSKELNFCSGDSVILSVTNNPDYSYSWKLNEGSIGSDKNELVTKISGEYTVEVSNLTGCSATSINTITVNVSEAPVVSNLSINGSTSFCEGDSLQMGTTFEADKSYQWFKDDNPLLNASTNLFVAKEEGTYKLGVSSGNGCTGYSSEITALVLPLPPSLTIATDNVSAKKGILDFDNLCVGDSVNLNLTDNPELSYQWKLNDNYIGIEGASLIAKSAGVYTAEITNNEGCSCETSNSISIDFNASPPRPILSAAGSITYCEGDKLLRITNYDSENVYSWILDETNTGNQTDQIVLSESGTYRVEARNAFSCVSKSEAAQVTILGDVKPEIELLAGDTLVCPDVEVILSVKDPLPSLEYQWQEGVNPISGALSSEYNVQQAGVYAVQVSAQDCDIRSDFISINYKPALPNPTIIAEGPSVWYLACSNDSAQVYRWYYEDMLIAESNEYIHVANQELGKYRVEITDDGDCFSSSETISIPENVVLGIDNIDPWENLKIYPNPTPGLFTLEMDNAIMGELIIDIFGATGSRVVNIKFEKELSHFKTQIDLSEQPAAVYLIGLELDRWRTTRRLVVE